MSEKDSTLTDESGKATGLVLAAVAGIILMIVFILTTQPEVPKDLLVTIQKGRNYKIVYDRETKVIYTMTDGKYNTGELFPMYNADGSLKLYTGE